jgi:hypothetical protein
MNTNETYNWGGRVLFCKAVEADDTLPGHTILWLTNKKSTHHLVIEANLQISADTLIEVTVDRKTGEIIQIVRPEQVTRKQVQADWMRTKGPEAGMTLSYLCFFHRKVGERPFAIKMAHDTIFTHNHKHNFRGHCEFCTDSSHPDHWFAMTSGARRVYLAANNLDGSTFLPDVIGSGAGIWEVYAQSIGKGLLHNQYRIPTTHGWQNRLFKIDRNTKMTGPLLRVIAFINRDVLDLLTDSPFVTLVSWNSGGTTELKVTAYARDEAEESALLDWIARFEKHSQHAMVVSRHQVEVVTC